MTEKLKPDKSVFIHFLPLVCYIAYCVLFSIKWSCGLNLEGEFIENKWWEYPQHIFSILSFVVIAFIFNSSKHTLHKYLKHFSVLVSMITVFSIVFSFIAFQRNLGDYKYYLAHRYDKIEYINLELLDELKYLEMHDSTEFIVYIMPENNEKYAGLTSEIERIGREKKVSVVCYNTYADKGNKPKRDKVLAKYFVATTPVVFTYRNGEIDHMFLGEAEILKELKPHIQKAQGEGKYLVPQSPIQKYL